MTEWHNTSSGPSQFVYKYEFKGDSELMLSYAREVKYKQSIQVKQDSTHTRSHDCSNASSARAPPGYRMLNLSNALSFLPTSSRHPQTFHIFIASSR